MNKSECYLRVGFTNSLIYKETFTNYQSEYYKARTPNLKLNILYLIIYKDSL